MDLILHVLFFLFAALVPSAVGAISGIGGGIIIKPVLDMFSGLTPAQINFLSGTTVLSMSLVSLLRSRKTGVLLERGRGTAIAIGAAAGGVAGKAVFDLFLALFPKTTFIGMVQSSVLCALAIMVFIYMRCKAGITPKNIHYLPCCAALGAAIGILSSFLGIGGGPVNIMIISYFFAMDSKTTALHSLYAICLSQAASLIFALITGSIPAVSWTQLVPMIAGGISGGIAGSAMLKKIHNSGVDMLFTIVLGIVTLLSLYNLLGFIMPFLHFANLLHN